MTDERLERRVVTILFADLAGSTALGEQLDPEDVRDLQSELFALVNAEVERFGGVTEKFVGDAILAVFGIPRAHDDDPERAVRAALAVQTAFPGFASRVADRFGPSVGLRVGVNTGEVVSGREAAARGELMVSGDAVNVAARLQQAADAGQVLVGARTRSATARAVAYGPRLEIDAKGKSGAVEAWPAESAAAEPAPRGVGGLSAPLIARDDELAILKALARRVERERAPQLVTLYGPAGVGKSRLLAELVRALPDTVLLEGRCLPYGDEIAYWPIAEAAKAHAGVLDSDAAATAREKLRDDVARVVGGESDPILEPILWTIGLELPESAMSTREVTQRLHDAWRRYFLALGHERPTLLAVEDVHWASPQLLDLLEYLADTLADAAVLIVCTARIELLEARPTWGAAKQNATALTLPPLAAADAGTLVHALLGQNGSLGAIVERVLARAEGNPFFVEEMLAMLIERELLVRSDDGWKVSADLSELPLPDSVHGVIAARLDLLEEEQRDALRRCSVVGRVFWPEAAGADEEVVAPLASRGLVSEQPVSSVAGMREFAFKHALTRDVAYASLPRGERRELHRRVAEWIQDVAPDRGLEAAELAAYHYGEPLTYGEKADAVAERAGGLFLTAGRAALQRGAFGAAERHLRRVLDLPVANEARAAALAALGELMMLSAPADAAPSLEQAREHLDAALELAPPSAVELRSHALAWRSRVSWLAGAWDDALRAASDAVEALRGRPESPELARALARRSQIAMLRDSADADELARQALDVANRVGDPFAIVNARINVLTLRGMSGLAPDPREVLELVDAGREIGANEEAYRALVNFVWIAAGHIHVDDVLATVAAGSATLEGVPLTAGLEWYMPISIALLHLLPAGRFDELERGLVDADPKRMGPTNYIPWLGLRAQVLTRRGDLDAAGELVEKQRELAFQSGEPQRIIPMACAYLPWAALSGRRAELRDVTTRVLAEVSDRWAAGLTALPAVRALDRAGEHDLLRAWLESFGRSGRRGASARFATTIAVAEGLIAKVEGRPEEAAQAFAQAAATERSFGYEFDAAAIDLDLADALESSGERERAGELRASCDAFMASIGCVHPL